MGEETPSGPPFVWFVWFVVPFLRPPSARKGRGGGLGPRAACAAGPPFDARPATVFNAASPGGPPMVDVPGRPATTGVFAPQRCEADVLDCEVVGTLPSDLAGAFVRLGGEWYYPPLFPDDAPLNADGYVSMFRFRAGRVAYRGRFVRTERFEANLAAGRQLYGYYRNAHTDDPAVRDLAHPARRTVANTAPLAFAGQLLALKEDGLPYRIDPATLATLGTFDYGGRLASQTHTAHPKLDPVTGELVTFGYEATGPASKDVFVYTVAPDGRITREVRFEVPYVSLMHDIALTQEHILFPFGGYVTSPEILEAGKIHWWWDRTRPSMIGVLPRDGEAKDLRWFQGPERCMMHTINARTENGKVILEAPFWDSNFFPFFPNLDGAPFDAGKARAWIRRYVLDLNSKDDRWHEETLFQTPVVDLARIDPRFLTLDQRYAFTGFADPDAPFDAARAGAARRPRRQQLRPLRPEDRRPGALLRRRRPFPAGMLLRPAPREHGRGRRLPHRRRDQPRRAPLRAHRRRRPAPRRRRHRPRDPPLHRRPPGPRRLDPGRRAAPLTPQSRSSPRTRVLSPSPAHPRESGDPGFFRVVSRRRGPEAPGGATQNPWIPASAGMSGSKGGARGMSRPPGARYPSPRFSPRTRVLPRPRSSPRKRGPRLFSSCQPATRPGRSRLLQPKTPGSPLPRG